SARPGSAGTGPRGGLPAATGVPGQGLSYLVVRALGHLARLGHDVAALAHQTVVDRQMITGGGGGRGRGRGRGRHGGFSLVGRSYGPRTGGPNDSAFSGRRGVTRR